MAAPLTDINQLRIATPCPMNWEQMTGDSRVRFCDQCQLNVYNISELSRLEIESLIASSEGRICGRLYRRSDGTVLTKDCPVGLRALRLRVSKRAAAVFAAIASLSGAAFGQNPSAKDDQTACTPQTRITRTDVSPQQTANVLSGNVLDPARGAVPGAKVTLLDAENQAIKTTTTNDAGRFEFASLTGGNYSVIIEATGFKSFQLKNISVEPDKVVNLETIIELTGELSGGFNSGLMLLPFSPVDTRTPGTTIISGEHIRRLPIPK